MAHDDHTPQSHDHPHGHGHGHEPEPESAPAAGAIPDLAKVAILVNNWIDHNEGHRRTYLEWRDKLTEAGVPATVAALARIADLTDQATAALRSAAVELRDARPPQG